MEKIKKHFINNAAIYLVLLACIVIVCICLFVTRENDTVPHVDTSMFIVVTPEKALALFEEKDPRILVIGVDDCQATVNYVPYLKIAQAKYGFNTYYLELNDVDPEDKNFIKLLEKLDMDYNLKGVEGKFKEFIGTTPMTVIIKNNKMVHGYIGSMNTTTLHTLTKLYGVATKDEEN